ncbi:MAG TPA: S8 family serine peptidase [Williamwhitmania sp.]|nr:S8 family serine peptidase [Williamwhitmania sp.]
MKKVLLLMTMLMVVGSGWAQRRSQDLYTVTINGSSISPPANFQEVRKGLPAEGVKRAAANATHFILQFNSIPTIEEQKQLKAQGITLLDYLHGHAYYVSVSSQFYSITRNDSKNIRSLMEVKPEYKIEKQLASGNIPDYAKVDNGYVKVVITFFRDIDEATVKSGLANIKMGNVQMEGVFHQFSAIVSIADLAKIASFDWVQNIEPIAPPAELENNHGRTLHRANVLNSSIRGLGYGLTGKGVKVGLWDADVENHRDFNGRVTNREYEMHTTDHGTHTCGTIAGAGLLDPIARGMAPDALVYAWNFNTQSNGLSVPYERLLSLDNDGIELTSNSWGYNVTTCPNPFAYNGTDHNEDLIAGWYPYFLYVFSAGNNQTVCSGGYNTTSKNMKNSLMVAAVDATDNMSSFSSFGPSYDGRLIPNISGDGVDVYSTFFNDGYGYMSGTSMATPGVAGTMALVYQRYKDTHGGQRPISSFLRALAFNTAHDLGNPGPDYKFGYGEIDGYRAVQVMERNTYYVDSVGQAATATKTITVPAGAVALRVMLAWTDVAGTPGDQYILVNDLDLSVSHDGNITLPWVLDPSNPSAPAVRDYDGLNNMEQVTLDHPAAGEYTINVDGYAIPDGKQEFAIVYDVVMPELQLTYPIGTEYLTPGNDEVIRWDCEGYSGTFTLEYSTDGGVNYSVIASGIPSSSRSYLWTVPSSVTTANAKIRISNGSVFSVSKEAFNVMPTPQNVKVGVAHCDGAGPFTLQWDAVPNAKYEVLKLNGQVYEHLADATTNSYDIANIEQSNNNWYCVRAIDLTTGAVSERSLAVTVNPSIAVTALPFAESFESQKADNFYFTGVYGQGNVRYVNDAQKYGIRLEGPTTSTDWVASTDAACFTSNPNYVVTAGICNIDASSITGKLYLKFDYRQKYRSAAGTSYFRVKVNGDYLSNTAGTQIYGSTNTVNYKTVYYDLSAYAGLSSVNVEFEAVCKTNYTTYINSSGNYDFSNDSYDSGDFVTIDNVEISEPQADMAMTSLIAGSGITNAETITVTVKNYTGADVSNIPVSYQINGGALVSETIPGPIAPFAEVTYPFAQTADFSAEGIHDVTASVNWPNDPVTSNNTQTATVINNGDAIIMGVATNPTATCSGVFTDGGGKYSNYANSSNSTLTIQPDAVGKNTKVTFTEFATEDTYDFLYIYNGPTATASALLGQFTGSALPPSFTSSAAGGELTFKFTSDGSVNDIGWIANIECVDKPLIDPSVTAITAPTASGIKTSAETVTITVKNGGSQDLTNVDVYYQINSLTPVMETIASLTAGQSLAYSFTATADLSTPDSYTLKAWVDVAGDENADNNSVTTTITSVASSSDAGVSAISTLRPSRTTLSTIAATVKNYGNVPLSNIDVAYTVNGGAEVVQTIAGPIAAGGTSAITFATKADLTASNTTYSIDVYTKLVGDATPDNDKMSTSVVTPSISPTNVVGSFVAGSNTAVYAGGSPTIDLVNNYTIECWVNLSDPATYGHIFNKTNVYLWYNTSYGSVYYGTNSFVLSVTKSSGSFTWYVPNGVKKNTWQHLALTVTSGNVYTLYIDGVAQTWSVYSGTAGATKTNANYPICIGNRPSDLIRSASGNIDEVRVWNSSLNQPTIVANMMTDYPANTAGLVAYYKFIEGDGNYVYDYSSNDNTAVVYYADVNGMGDGKFWNIPGLLLTSLDIAGEKVPSTFDEATNTFNVVMDNADLSNLTATFTTSQQSIIKVGGVVQVSGVTANDFTGSPLTYTAEGTGFNVGINQNYTVNVANDLGSDCDLTAYSFEIGDNPTLTSAITLDANGNNFYKKVASGIDITSLKARFTISSGATLLINGVAQASPQVSAIDYSQPLMVTVQSENGRFIKNYSITVDARNSNADLIDFTIPNEEAGTTVIDAVNHTVKVMVNYSSDLSMLTPVFEVSPNASVYVGSITQLSGTTTNNFTTPLVYTVVSEDESTSVDWTVTVLNKSLATVTISDLSQMHDGTPKSVTVTTDPVGLAVDVTYNGLPTAPTEVGTYAVVATVNDVNYEGTQTASFEITPNTGINPNASDVVKIYSDGATLYVDIAGMKSSANLTVCNILGISVYQTTKLSVGLNRISSNIISGIYIVKLVVDGKTYSQRVVLNP